MARIEKYSSGIVGVIKHNLREFKDGICPTNKEVDITKKDDNYSIISRGKTAKEIEKYRKELMEEVFHYNRKNIVLCNEVICTLPEDCSPEQEKLFFGESYKYICSTLPMGEKAVLLAEVHCDEGKVLRDGVTVVEGAKHLHVMYVPAVPDLKHEGYEFRLCSDELTKRSVLKEWHPNYQKWLDEAGVHATVASGVTSGKGMSVKSLKELSKVTGLSLEQIRELEQEKKHLKQKLLDKEIESVQMKSQFEHSILEKDKELELAHGRIQELEAKLKTLAIERNSPEHAWGNSSWGNDLDWGRADTREKEREL